jgi:branched-chain amino acid transport system permease protein
LYAERALGKEVKRTYFPRWRIILSLAIVFLAVIPFLFPIPTFYIYLLASTFISVALAESWNIMGGYAGYVSFGNSVFFGIGAYVTAILLRDYGLSPFMTMFLGGVFAMGFAAFIGYPTLRLRATPYFSLATLAAALLTKEIFIAASDLTWGGRGIHNLHILGLSADAEPMVFYLSFLGLAVLTIFLAYRIENSKFGFALVAIRENEEVALTLGINSTKCKLIAFLISASLTGLIGGIYSPYLSWINPDVVFNLMISVSPVVMTAFGGKGRWAGPIIGAFTLELTRQCLSFVVMSELNLFVYGALLIVTIILIPKGILGLFRRR